MNIQSGHPSVEKYFRYGKLYHRSGSIWKILDSFWMWKFPSRFRGVIKFSVFEITPTLGNTFSPTFFYYSKMILKIHSGILRKNTQGNSNHMWKIHKKPLTISCHSWKNTHPRNHWIIVMRRMFDKKPTHFPPMLFDHTSPSP